MKRFGTTVALAVLATAAALTACGGGGEGDAEPSIGAPGRSVAGAPELPPGAKEFELLNVGPETQVDQRVAVKVLRAFTLPQQMNGAIANPGYTWLVMEFRGRNVLADRPTESSRFYLRAGLEVRADLTGCKDYQTEPDGFCDGTGNEEHYFRTGSSWNHIGDTDRMPNVPPGGTMDFAEVMYVKESVRPVDVRVTTEVAPGTGPPQKVVLAAA